MEEDILSIKVGHNYAAQNSPTNVAIGNPVELNKSSDSRKRSAHVSGTTTEVDAELDKTPPLKKLKSVDLKKNKFSMKYATSTPIGYKANVRGKVETTRALKELNSPQPRASSLAGSFTDDNELDLMAKKYNLSSPASGSRISTGSKDAKLSTLTKSSPSALPSTSAQPSTSTQAFRSVKINNSNKNEDTMAPIKLNVPYKDDDTENEHSDDDEEEVLFSRRHAFRYNRGFQRARNFDWRTANLYDLNDVRPKTSGERGRVTFQAQSRLVKAKMEQIIEDINQIPSESVVAMQPFQFKDNIRMKQHQLHALRFMKWRENRKPAGGIICDEMGKKILN